MEVLINKKNNTVRVYTFKPKYDPKLYILKTLTVDEINIIRSLKAKKLNYLNGAFVDSATEEDIEEELRKSIRAVYQVPHEFEGNETYQEFRVDLIRSLQKEEISQDELFEIEDLLEPIYSRVKNGNWKTALFVLNQTDMVDPLLIIYKNKAKEEIENYINNNY